MKTLTIYLTIVVALAITTTTSWGQNPEEMVAESVEISIDSEKEIADAKKEIKKAQSIFMLDYQKLKKDFEVKHKNNELRIADLKSEIMQLNTKDKSAMYQKEVSDLAQKNSKMKKMLSEYNDEGIDEWTSFKNKFNHDADELGKALKDFSINNDD